MSEIYRNLDHIETRDNVLMNNFTHDSNKNINEINFEDCESTASTQIAKMSSVVHPMEVNSQDSISIISTQIAKMDPKVQPVRDARSIKTHRENNNRTDFSKYELAIASCAGCFVLDIIGLILYL